ncbi:hypothetical protein [Halegenticoccus soli]|uniref:hypothetical protein n=1 Tax=Halegenticoccus soli TaxID=1985678 RepID=UPI000C6DC149|nr:hypothetical protein [Halegenticoccus soli]
MFPETIETDRLRLRRLSRETVDPLDAYAHDGKSDTIEEETRYLSWSPHGTPKETRDALRRFEERWDDAEDAVYAIVPRDCHRYTASRAEWREAIGDEREARFVDE